MSEVNSVGEILRQRREAKGDNLEAVHDATKISVDVLNALEHDDFESFESDIYLKGFIRTYAQYLGADVEQLFRALEKQRGGTPVGGGATWELEESVTEEKLKSPKIFRRVVVPLLFILILILTLLFINERRKVNRLTTDNARAYLESGQNASLSG